MAMEESPKATDPSFAWADGRRSVWRVIQTTINYIYQLLEEDNGKYDSWFRKKRRWEIPTSEPVKLYAGKYKSIHIQELEKAYTNSSTVFNENRALKEKYKVPENYVVPEISLPETVINDLQQLAKSAGFNQEQFDKTIVSIHEQKNSSKLS